MPTTLTVALLQLTAFDRVDHERAWVELLRRIDDAAADAPRLIVTPEASYPAGLPGAPAVPSDEDLHSDAELLAALVERALRHRCYIAAGVVLHRPGGAPRNAAILISPQGVEIARAVQATPPSWFAPGDGPLTAEIDGVTVGLFAGDDANDPAATAMIAGRGARLLISTGAATSWGRAADGLAEPDAHVLLTARAIEAGAWAVTPAKVGVEAASRVYSGRAGVIDPRGAWAVRAPSDRPGVVVHTIDLEAAGGAPVVARNDLTTSPVPAQPPRVTDVTARRVAAIAMNPTPSSVDLMERLRALVRSVAVQGAGLVVVPDLAGIDAHAVTSAETLPLLEALGREAGVVMVIALAERDAGVTHKTAYVIDRGVTVAAHRQSHVAVLERTAGFVVGNDPPPVVATSAGTIGLLSGVEGLVPSLGASLRQRGAALLAWCAGALDVPTTASARARAIEQRLPVVVAGSAADGSGSSIIDETGAVVATTLAGRTMVAHAAIRVR